MASTVYVDFRPTWKGKSFDDMPELAETPNLGFEPAYAPRLPIRIIPPGHRSSIPGRVLTDALNATQRILNYASYEAVNGVRLDFADLRSADARVLELAKLEVEPFEAGSFIIPTALSEKPVAIEVDGTTKDFSSRQVLDRFVDAFQAVGEPDGGQYPVSLGLIQAIEELGKVTRQDVECVEYFPVGLTTQPNLPRRLSADRQYIESVCRNRKQRQDPKVIRDSIEGRLIAVDLGTGKLKLELRDRSVVRGTFPLLIQERVIASLNKAVKLDGIIEHRNKRPFDIRAVDITPFDE